MQLRLPWLAPPARPVAPPRARAVIVDGRPFEIEVTRHRWARRYLMRLTLDGRVRLTVPRGASIAGGLAFVHAETGWIAQEWARVRARGDWRHGTRVWVRGESHALESIDGEWRLGGRPLQLKPSATDVRVAMQAAWRREATAELPDRCRLLGVAHGLVPRRVSVRDQRTRWGACSAKGAITLNWRLVQMPPAVADYVMLHELAHLEQPNHSRRFWRKVASICPDWRDAERWLRRHGRELL